MRRYRHSLGLYSDSSDSDVSSSDEEGVAKAVKVYNIEVCRVCDMCKAFHEYGTLACGHLIPHVDISANMVHSLEGKLLTYCYKWSEKKLMIRDTGASLAGVSERLVLPENYTGKYVTCPTFGGTKEKYPLAWIEVTTAFISKKLLAAVLLDPWVDLILGT